MSESVVVNISGTAFSLLLYENIRNNYDQEGFLLGEIVTNEKRSITDNDQEVVTIEHIIKINSVLPCPRLGHFFDNAGQVDAEKIVEFLHDKKDRVVSWYKFKRTSSFKLTLREKIVMKQLATYFMPVTPERFTCCLLTSQIGSELGATHIFSQTFIRYFKSAYQSLPMHIINLKDPHDFYQNPEKCSNLFGNIVKSLKINKKTAQGYATVDSIETALDNHIGQIVGKLETSEQQVHRLEMEVDELRRQLNVTDNSSDSVDEFLTGDDADADANANVGTARAKRRTRKDAGNSSASDEVVFEKRNLRNTSPRKS